MLSLILSQFIQIPDHDETLRDSNLCPFRPGHGQGRWRFVQGRRFDQDRGLQGEDFPANLPCQRHVSLPRSWIRENIVSLPLSITNNTKHSKSKDIFEPKHASSVRLLENKKIEPFPLACEPSGKVHDIRMLSPPPTAVPMAAPRTTK